ncbi:MAG: hypothetical protein A3G20_09995 [Acidobacteria bacterium RIFCSPLOWO2_12_FULL_59_11]|nr:MAG: hypothetical protein A3G20_09995 [Acidobacteria bacterium RIFCSPLOWO2_12_FULL_59_11]
MRHTHLFANVPDRDYLGFWADQTLQAKSVADFMGLDRREVARVAGVSSASVRWDQKIPREVLDRLTEIAVVCSLVAQFFEGDAVKTKLWFQTRNPLFGNLSPCDMIRNRRYEKLRRFVMDALVENGIPVPAAVEVRVGGRSNRPRKGAAA